MLFGYPLHHKVLLTTSLRRICGSNRGVLLAAGDLHIALVRTLRAMSASAPPEPVFADLPALATSVCWRCSGTGYRLTKDKSASKPEALTGVPCGPNLKRVPCTLCNGAGSIARAKRTKKDASARVSKFEATGWTFVGPAPAPDTADSSLVVRPGEDLSFLTGQWRIFQEHASHRYSTDDVVTAWVSWRLSRLLPEAARAAPRCLDIGCGIGSVLLMNAWLHPAGVCTGVEAQATRASQAARSVRYNGVQGRVRVFNGDLRDATVFEGKPLVGDASSALASSASSSADAALRATHGPPFDIITGTPPYFNVITGAAKGPPAPWKSDADAAKPASAEEAAGGAGRGASALPASEESARCLFEYRGGIEEYAASAARWLAKPHGLFTVVESSLGVSRGYAAAAAAGLRVIARVDAVPRAGKPPLFSVFVMCHADAPYQPVLPAEAAIPGSSAVSAAAATSSAAGSTGAAASSAAAPTSAMLVSPTLFAPEGRSPYDATDASAGDASAESAVDSTAAAAARHAAGGDGAGSESGSDSDVSPSTVAAAAEASSSSAVEGASAPKTKKGKPVQQQGRQQPKPFPGSMTGEVVYTITVRGEDNARTVEYGKLLRDLGKPS